MPYRDAERAVLFPMDAHDPTLDSPDADDVSWLSEFEPYHDEPPRAAGEVKA